MSYSFVYLLSAWLEGVRGLGIVMIIVDAIVGGALLVLWLSDDLFVDVADWDKEDSKVSATTHNNKIKRWIKFGIITLAIVIVILVFVPSQKQFLTYVSLRAVDNYNASVDTSSVNAEGIVQVIDMTLQKITMLLK